MISALLVWTVTQYCSIFYKAKHFLWPSPSSVGLHVDLDNFLHPRDNWLSCEGGLPLLQ